MVSRSPQHGLLVDVGKILCKINEVKEELNMLLNERVRYVQTELKGSIIATVFTKSDMS